MLPYINIHTHTQADRSVSGNISVASYRLGSGDVLPPEPFTAGIHPWDAGRKNMGELLQELEELNIIAVGEIGLDYARGRETKKEQEAILRPQLYAAVERGLPVVLHCVKAFEDMMNILKGYPVPNVIFHGYTGSLQQTRRLIEAGYCVSAGPVSLLSSKTVQSLRTLPKERLFLETDCSDTSIEEVYSHASEALGLPLQTLKQDIYDNYNRLFTNL